MDSVNLGLAGFNEELCFDLLVSNIPRMARLCLVVYEISKSAKGVRSRRLKDSKQVRCQRSLLFLLFYACI